MKLALGLTLALGGSAAAAEPCRVAAVLEGDAELVDSITTALAGRGIETTAAAECPAAKARIGRRGAAIVVSVEDPDGRRSERALDDVEAAASLIESWARQDMNAALLFGWTYAAPDRTPERPVAEAQVVPPPARPSRDPITLHAGGETSIGFDGSAWVGGSVGACVRVGVACIGATARLLAGVGAGTRRGYDVLGAVEVPIRRGRIVVVPGAAVGAGRIELGTSQGQDSQRVREYGARGDAHVSIAYALAGHLAIHAGLSAGASLFGATDAQNLDGNSIPGEPRGFVRADLGLRIGAP
jgi:hypothetical protein